MSSDRRLQRHEAGCLQLSIVVPAYNEYDCLDSLVNEIEDAFSTSDISIELLYVNDGSKDATVLRLRELMATRPWIRLINHPVNLGQAAAMYTGIQSAAGRFIATLDADLQNDPSDLILMVEELEQSGVALIQGDRSRNRQDNVVRRAGSWVGKTVRRLILGDNIRDTGCSIRVMHADLAKQLPLFFRGMHRFIPAYLQMTNGKVLERPVNHRPRYAGTTKYGFGILNRGAAGLVDCLAVRWMSSRYVKISSQEAP